MRSKVQRKPPPLSSSSSSSSSYCYSRMATEAVVHSTESQQQCKRRRINNTSNNNNTTATTTTTTITATTAINSSSSPKGIATTLSLVAMDSTSLHENVSVMMNDEDTTKPIPIITPVLNGFHCKDVSDCVDVNAHPITTKNIVKREKDDQEEEDEDDDHDSIKVNVRSSIGVNTGHVESMTEDELFGPCTPGTQINLDAIVWLESSGLLVVNVPWRGRTYVGTLLDSSKHCYAPTNLYGYQSAYETSRGRGKRRSQHSSVRTTRGAVGACTVGGTGTTTTTPTGSKNRSSLNSRQSALIITRQVENSNGIVGGGGGGGVSVGGGGGVSGHNSAVDESGEDESHSTISGQNHHQQNDLESSSSTIPPSCDSQTELFPCTRANCHHRFTKVTALRYHETLAHGDSVELRDRTLLKQKQISSNNNNSSSTSNDNLTNITSLTTSSSSSRSSKRVVQCNNNNNNNNSKRKKASSTSPTKHNSSNNLHENCLSMEQQNGTTNAAAPTLTLSQDTFAVELATSPYSDISGLNDNDSPAPILEKEEDFKSPASYEPPPALVPAVSAVNDVNSLTDMGAEANNTQHQQHQQQHKKLSNQNVILINGNNTCLANQLPQ